jgi:putative transposase
MFKHLPKFNLPGSAHFVTTNSHLNVPIFADPFAAAAVLEELAFYRLEYGFKVGGYVVMPSHFHCILWWDETAKRELTIGKIMQGVKGSSSRRIIEHYISTGKREQLLASTRRHLNKPHRRNPRAKVWQDGYYDFNITTEKKLFEKLNYIHNNPVRAGLCEDPEGYPSSSAWYYAGLEKPKGLKAVICPIDSF